MVNKLHRYIQYYSSTSDYSETYCDAAGLNCRLHIFNLSFLYWAFSLLLCCYIVEKLSAIVSLSPPIYRPPHIQCTARIMELLEVAKSSIPSSLWNITPVVLKATAGLRLLPGEKANHLLDRVRHTHFLYNTPQHCFQVNYTILSAETFTSKRYLSCCAPDKRHATWPNTDTKQTQTDKKYTNETKLTQNDKKRCKMTKRVLKAQK